MARNREHCQQSITDIEYTGHGITRVGEKVVFVEGALPGEVVDIAITRRRKSHSFARVTAWHENSPLRTRPFCSHFDDCGGCTWQYLPYPEQLRYKQRFVADILRSIGHISEPAPLPIIGCESDRFYRNKLDFSFAPFRWITQAEVDEGTEVADRRGLGFHVKGRFDRVLQVNECFLQKDPSNRIRNTVRDISMEMDLSYHDPKEHVGLLRGLIVRTSQTGGVMVILVIGEDSPEMAVKLLTMLGERVPEVTSAWYLVNASMNEDIFPHPAIHVFGEKILSEKCGHLTLAIHPKSFFQTNSTQAERLYGVVRDWLDASGSEVLLDLYCGIGSIGLFVADMVGSVVGVESIPEAIDRARENAKLNGISNVRFLAGDVKEILAAAGGGASASDGGSSPIPRPEIVILDPPRAGLHPDALQSVMALAPRQIIYVSCKPTTQARDLVKLLEAYRIEQIQPVDMFPHTFHIENIVDLRRR